MNKNPQVQPFLLSSRPPTPLSRFIVLPHYQFARGGAPFQRSWPTSSEKRITHLSLLSFLQQSRVT